MDYTTLIADKNTSGSIKNWVNYNKPDVTNCVVFAESYIYQRLRVREMTFYATLALASGDETKAYPANFLDPIAMVLRSPWSELMSVDADMLLKSRIYDDANVLVTGPPTKFSVPVNGMIYFDTKMDQAYSADFAYFGRLPALSGSNLTNFLTDKYPLILFESCLGFACGFMEEPDAKKEHLAVADALMDDAKVQDDLKRRSMDTRI